MALRAIADKQGRIAGENAIGGRARFVLAPTSSRSSTSSARTGLREHDARAADRGWTPATTATSPDDHKAYYPGATPIHIRITGDRSSGLQLGPGWSGSAAPKGPNASTPTPPRRSTR